MGGRCVLEFCPYYLFLPFRAIWNNLDFYFFTTKIIEKSLDAIVFSLKLLSFKTLLKDFVEICFEIF